MKRTFQLTTRSRRAGSRWRRRARPGRSDGPTTHAAAATPVDGNGNDRATRRQAGGEDSWKKGRPIAMQDYRRGWTSAVSTCSRRPRIPASSSPASSSTSTPRSRRRCSRSRTATRPLPNVVNGVEREPARRHRIRLQQLDGEPGAARAARARHPRRADELPVVTASQRDLGQGRLHPDRRVADRLRRR